MPFVKFVVELGGGGGGGLLIVVHFLRGLHTKSWPPAMPRTLLKVFVGGGIESEVSVHLWSKALA